MVFFCTDTDPATGKPGSRVQVEGKGQCVKANPGDDKCTLPNIPTQCELATGAWEMAIVAADDLDDAYTAMRKAIAHARAAHPDARLIADYTGGTKSMSAALVLAALDEGDVTLQLVAGARADLIKVRDGTQMAAPGRVDAIRLKRDMAPFLAAWGRHAYDEAAAGLAALSAPADPRLRQAWQRARDLSDAFAAWDRFDHIAALERLGTYEAKVAPVLGRSYPDLKLLARGDGAAAEGLRIWDLWLNAQRRAVAGRYDDAVARAYRVLEWTAQWVLATRKGWKTGDLPVDIATAAGIAPSHDGLYQAGLFPAWRLVAQNAGGPAAAFFAEQQLPMLDHIKRRNQSILAHGFTPVQRDDWHAFAVWLNGCFEPMLREELAAIRVRQPFAQLPDRYLWEDPTP